MTLLLICLVIIAISLLAVGGYLIYEFIKYADKKRVDKIMSEMNRERRFYEMLNDLEYLRAEVEILKKKRRK